MRTKDKKNIENYRVEFPLIAVLILSLGTIGCTTTRSRIDLNSSLVNSNPKNIQLEFQILPGQQMSQERLKEFERHFSNFRQLLPKKQEPNAEIIKKLSVVFRLKTDPTKYVGRSQPQYTSAALSGEISFLSGSQNDILWKSDFKNYRYAEAFISKEYNQPEDAPFDEALINPGTLYYERGTSFLDRVFQFCYMVYGPSYLEEIIGKSDSYATKSAVRAVTVDKKLGLNFAKKILENSKKETERLNWILSSLSFDKNDKEALKFLLNYEFDPKSRYSYIQALSQFKNSEAIQKIIQLAENDTDSGILHALLMQTGYYFTTISEYKRKFPHNN